MIVKISIVLFFYLYHEERKRIVKRQDILSTCLCGQLSEEIERRETLAISIPIFSFAALTRIFEAQAIILNNNSTSTIMSILC